MSPPSASSPSGNPARLLFGALVCVLAIALIALALHAHWLHSQVTELRGARASHRASDPPDRHLERLVDLESQVRALARSAATQAPLEKSGPPQSPSNSPPAPAPTLAYGPLLDRMQLLETTVLRGLGYSFDAPPEPAVVDALLARPFAGPRHRHGPQPSAYSPEQLLGPPDAQAGASNANAWCSLEPDGGFEWIEAHFEARDTPRAVLVRETSAPGAVVQIEAQDAAGQYKVIWAGEPNPTRRPGDFVIQLSQDAFATRALRITLDSAAVPGWNEIDAVGVITASGIHWAASASASSVWGGGQQEVFATPAE